MKKRLSRLLSMFLCLTMVVALVPAQTFAYYVEDAESGIRKTADGTAVGTISGTDAQGNATTIDYDEKTWTETYPYGAFAFEKSSLALQEGGSGVIRVYRLGGTAGRATAYLTYKPVLVENEDGERIYDYAVSARDIDILVEEPQPAAQYQPVGKAPDPQRGSLTVVSTADEQGFVLSLSGAADSYRWQILSDGFWRDITDSETAELPMDAEYLDESAYDYRCVYEKSGVSFCTDSYFGEPYVAPAEEELPPMPENIELNAAPVYTALNLRGEGEDPYAGWAFELIFADGEWVKEIHLDALTDGISEAQEAAALTIEDCYGGAVLDAASTLLMSIADIDESGPSTLGFEVETLAVDKAEGTAEVMITRTGDASRPVSIEWATKDGTAKAGTDYVAASGTLMFYTGLTSLPATVELIDDGVETDETVDFTIELSELLGDDNCTFTAATATVSLYNSGTGDRSNLASRLYDAEAVDVSALLQTSPTSVGTGGAVVTGTAQEIEVPEPVYSELDFDSAAELTTQSKSLSNDATIKFANPANAWGSTADAATSGCWSFDTANSDADSEGGRHQMVYAPDGETGKLGTGNTVKITSGIALTSKGKARANFVPTGVGAANTKILTQMFSGYSADIEANFAHDTSYLKGSTYCYSYTHPCLIVDSAKVPVYIKRFGSGPLNSAWQIKGSDGWNNGDESKYSNPYDTKTSGTFTLGGTVNMMLDMSYHYEHDESKYTEHEDDWLNDFSMIWLKSMNLTRRSFAANAFSLEITTPNDANNAPGGAATLSDYSSFVPSISLAAGKGGASTANALYVGSKINIGIGTVPAAYKLDGVVIYQKSGNTWNVFNKFQTSVASDGKSITIDTIGSDSSPLTAADLTASYKIRLVYARNSTVTVDLTPSADKDGKTDHLFKTSYAAGEHGFAAGEGVGANITCGYSTFDSTLGDYNPKSITEEPVAKSSSTLTISKKNLQWINFNLSPEDTLLINGTAYPGNAKIWLNEAELNGAMNVLYYHRDFKKGINAMKTAISWMGLYLDSNGNGKIDGTFENNEFKLTENADTFCGYIDAGDRINEADLAPVKDSNGKYHQFFILAAYTMTPRCLDVSGVQGATADDKAAVLPAITTAVNASSGAYSALTGEQRAYRYVYSGKDANGNYTSDNHIMYGAEASAPSYIAIPLGGDKHPAELSGDGKSYVWTPDYNWGTGTGMIIPYAAPDPITIQESVAGPTPITTGYSIRYDGDVIDGYTYTADGAAQINGYLASLCGTSTFVLATQEQLDADGYKLSGSYTDYLATGKVKISDDCVTMSGVSTNPDAEYLKSVNDKQGSGSTEIDMDDSGNDMPEFNVDMGLNLGSLELGVTEAVTILLDENKIGFAIGVPLGSVEKDYDNDKMSGKNIKEANKENWTQFGEFFEKGNFGGDDSYKSAATNKQKVDKANAAKQQQASQQGTPQTAPRQYDKGAFQSKSFEISFNVQIAFMFEFNPLDNGYYFEGMTVSFSAELEFRIQARLTVCPLVYFYFQFEASIEITSGLGVTRDAVEVKTPKLDATSAGKEKDKKDLTYFTRPTDRVLVTAAEFNADLSKYPGYKQGTGEYSGYYYNANAYDSFESACAAYLETGDYYVNSKQYELLTESEKGNYTLVENSGLLYNKNNFTDLSAAEVALNKAQCYEFETNYKAFNVTFSGKLSVQVYEGSDSSGWTLNTTDYNSGFLTSDGTEATQVVIRTQDGMKLGKTVKVVLRAMEYDDKTENDVTTVTRVCEIEKIRNDVYWKGIEISPSVGIEVGAGIGVEMLKVELYAKVGLEAAFLLGIYDGNGNYDAAKVESFGFSIGLGLRVVALVFTFELDAVTYTIDYEDGEGWTRGFHFLNDWVDGYETSAVGEDEYAGVTIRMPKRTAQNLYAPEDNIEGELRTQAVSYPGIPFQLSSYDDSVDAAVLTDHMMSGSQYRIFSAGGRNFIIYTLSRSAAAEEDSTMLVLSELTYVRGNGKGATYGLANPVDSTSETKYITLDNDATGDLDFDVWVDSAVSGNDTAYTVHTAWVSYAEAADAKSKPTEPIETKPVDMTADNYNTLPAPEVTATEEGEEKQAQEEALAAFNAWHDYYAALDNYNAWVQQRLANAAKNTVVKTADWSFTKTAAENAETTYGNGAAFAEPTVIGGDNAGGETNLVFSPVGSSSAVFYGSADTLDTSDTAYNAYCDYLKAVYGTNPDANTQKMVNGLKAIRKSSLDVYGTRSALNAKIGTNAVSTIVLGDGQVLTDLQVTELDGKYYLAYTTTQYEYDDFTLNNASTKDMVTVTRLYLRTFELVTGESTTTPTWGDPLLLRETHDFERQDGKDGCYSNSGIVSVYDSAYISNLQFLTANIDAAKLTGGETPSTQDVTEDTFLLFEMNGATYIILSGDLKSLTNSTPGTVYPFFNTVTTVKNGKTTVSPSGKDNVTIGADKNGTPYAVYTAAVENTTNNALYVSKYDAASGTWGEGIMLAMNNMNVYEAARDEGWDAETTQAAYLGLHSKGEGLLTNDDISHLFGDKAADINKTLGAITDTTLLGDSSNFVFAGLQATAGADGNNLLVVSEGIGSTMTVQQFGDDVYSVVPMQTNGSMDTTNGLYAVSYGGGVQELGNASISFNKADFSKGSELYVTIAAENVGTSAFRYSPTDGSGEGGKAPLTATLKAGTQELAKWTVEENLLSGQTLALEGYCTPLANDLPTGTKFILTLSEDSTYFTTGAASASVTLFTLEAIPDLGVEGLTAAVTNIGKDSTELNVSFTAANRGSGQANGVYAQFSYRTGTDDNGNGIYAKLDLTGHHLTVGQETLLSTNAMDLTPANGILLLSGKDFESETVSQNLKAGHGRTVSGTITVPAGCFDGTDGTLELKVELFSANDTTSLGDGGVVTAVSRKEYYTANNLSTQAVPAETVFTVADSIVIPLGTTTLIPLTAVSALGEKPNPVVQEIDDSTEGDGFNIGILNFKMSSSDRGRADGVISITPTKAGSGIIELNDVTTNTKKAIAFTVTEVGEGIDIYNNNSAFTFKNEDESTYDKDKGNQSWTFTPVEKWGTGDNAETPLRSNLSVGQQGASFTFTTVAESIDLYFSGSISVTSTFPGFGTKTYSGVAGKQPVTIEFGTNGKNTAYTVTVKVTSNTANFDRLVEHYSGGTTPIPSYDGESPAFYWSRSFPATASIGKSSGKTIPLKLYVLDNEAVSYITVDGTRYDTAEAGVSAFEKIDSEGQLWCYDFGEIAENKNYAIAAYDASGNMTAATLVVDWFADSVSGDADTISVPVNTADFKVDGGALPAVITVNEVNDLNITFAGGAEAYEVHYLASDFLPVSVGSEANVFPIGSNGNGIYLTYVYGNEAKTNWSAKMLVMDRVDQNVPQISLTFDSSGKSLNWSVYKEGSGLIDTVTVNGYKVNSSSGTTLSGSVPIVCSGDYTLAATVGSNSVSQEITVSALGVDISRCTFTAADAWNVAQDNGSITADLSGICGGYYTNTVPSGSIAPAAYTAAYEIALAKEVVSGEGEETTTEWVIGAWESVSGTKNFTGLVPGEYQILVRDKTNPADSQTVSLTVAGDPVTVTTAVKGTSGGSGEIAIIAGGGGADAFEYAILPADGKTTVTTADEFLALGTAENPIVWQTAAELNDFTITGLNSGDYVIAVRGVYAADEIAALRGAAAEVRAKQAALDNAKENEAVAKAELNEKTEEAANAQRNLDRLTPGTDAYAEAEETLEKANNEKAARQTAYDNAVTAREAAETALANAQTECTSKQAELQKKSAADYADGSEYWNGVLIFAANVPYVAPAESGGIQGVSANENDVLVYKVDDTLTANDSKAIVSSNADSDVLVISDNAAAFIPEGTLPERFDVNRLMASAAEDGSDEGKVIRYTDLEGNETIIPFGIVDGDKASYFVYGPGDYEIVEGEADFIDIAGLWGEEQIDFVTRRCLFYGTGDGYFSPDLPMNRAMFVTVLWRMSGCPAWSTPAGFTDLEADWYADAVAWACENGIVSGYDETTFGPNDPVTREQMCALVLRYLNYLGMDLSAKGDEIAFKDADQISAWAKDAVDLCSSIGLINGYDGHVFAPKNGATRMEISAVLTRFITALIEEYCS